jgi:hypothetical protein
MAFPCKSIVWPICRYTFSQRHSIKYIYERQKIRNFPNGMVYSYSIIDKFIMYMAWNKNGISGSIQSVLILKRPFEIQLYLHL